MSSKKKPLTAAQLKKIWDKTSPAQRRVLVAKDVIAQIVAKQYIPTQRTWVYFKSIPASAKRGRISAQECLLGQESQCACCALGGLMLSVIKHTNEAVLDPSELRVKYIDEGSLSRLKDEVIGGHINDSHNTSFVTSQKLQELFGEKELSQIENFFEKGSGAFDGGSVRRNGLKPLTDFSSTGGVEKWNALSSEDRLKSIMLNIVENKGKFVPEKLPQFA